jgi:Uma2 family endonuclease
MTQQLLGIDQDHENSITEVDISHLVLEDDEIDEDDIFTELDISHLELEDDTPVDNFQSEKQQRLLVEPLYSSQVLPTPFLAVANVGLFYKIQGDPVVPDAMLSLGVSCPGDFSQKKNLSYLAWEMGKNPEVCIEVISNQEGDELTVSCRSQRKGKTVAKKDLYAQIGIPYYAVFDPLQRLQGENEMNGQLLKVFVLNGRHYVELVAPFWLEDVGLGLTVWEGEFEQLSGLWLRWCDRAGKVILTGAEGQEAERQRAEAESQRAEAESQRADRLADRLRAMGINPDEV